MLTTFLELVFKFKIGETLGTFSEWLRRFEEWYETYLAKKNLDLMK